MSNRLAHRYIKQDNQPWMLPAIMAEKRRKALYQSCERAPQYSPAIADQSPQGGD